MNIFITGGAGYIGSQLAKVLIAKNYKVTIFDNLSFGFDHLISIIDSPNLNIFKGDVSNIENLKDAKINDHEIIIHLASIVGYPACRLNPRKAEETNIEGTKNIIKLANKDQWIIYSSTGSNYGSVNTIAYEETELNPLSLYAQTKVISEKLISQFDNSIIYRFATAFGPSLRMRLDLMINDFLFKAYKEGYLVVYEKNFKRTFIHIDDIVASFVFAIEQKNNMKKNIYNVGDNSLNFSKEDICKKIQNLLPNVYVNYADIGTDLDKRNYSVSFDKINKLGFKTSFTIEHGMRQLLKIYKFIELNSKYKNV